MSTSMLSTAPCCERVGGEPQQPGDEQIVEQEPDSDTTYSIFLESESSDEEYSSDSDDDIMDFLETMKLAKPKTQGVKRTGAENKPNTQLQQTVSRAPRKDDKNGGETSKGIPSKMRCNRRGPYGRGPLTALQRHHPVLRPPKSDTCESKDLAMHNSNTKVSSTNTNHNRKRYKCKNIESVNVRSRKKDQNKMYTNELEEKVTRLESENEKLTSRLFEKSNQVDLMKNEINYLKSVIANQTSLSSLLNYIPFSKGMQLGSSLLPFVETRNTPASTNRADPNSKKRERDESSDPKHSELSITAEGDDVFVVKRLPTKRAPELPLPRSVESTTSASRQTTPGVCLHVSNDKISLEFCPLCATNAATATALSGDRKYRSLLKTQK